MANQSGRANARVLRNYRNLTPGNFHIVNQRISNALTDNNRIPDFVWTANPTLLAKYLEVSGKHDAAYHRALQCGKGDIADRAVLQGQLVTYLDEIALILETAALSNPDTLITSGFDLAKERRSRGRTTTAGTASETSTAEEPVSQP